MTIREEVSSAAAVAAYKAPPDVSAVRSYPWRGIWA